jgi:hypothetical protein
VILDNEDALTCWDFCCFLGLLSSHQLKPFPLYIHPCSSLITRHCVQVFQTSLAVIIQSPCISQCQSSCAWKLFAGRICNLTSLSIYAKCFVFDTIHRQWSFSHQVGWGHQTLCLSLFKYPFTSQLTPSHNFSHLSLSWLSLFICCGQLSWDILSCDCSLFSRNPEYLSCN